VEGGVGPAYCVLGEGTTRCHHLVEGSDAVSGLELIDVGADAVDVAGDVVTGVEVGLHVVGGDFPGRCVNRGSIGRRDIGVRGRSREYYIVQVLRYNGDLEVDIPVFGVTTRVDDLDDDLVGLWLGDSDILDGDRKVFCYLCFLHPDNSFFYKSFFKMRR